MANCISAGTLGLSERFSGVCEYGKIVIIMEIYYIMMITNLVAIYGLRSKSPSSVEAL